MNFLRRLFTSESRKVGIKVEKRFESTYNDKTEGSSNRITIDRMGQNKCRTMSGIYESVETSGGYTFRNMFEKIYYDNCSSHSWIVDRSKYALILPEILNNYPNIDDDLSFVVVINNDDIIQSIRYGPKCGKVIGCKGGKAMAFSETGYATSNYNVEPISGVLNMSLVDFYVIVSYNVTEVLSDDDIIRTANENIGSDDCANIIANLAKVYRAIGDVSVVVSKKKS